MTTSEAKQEAQGAEAQGGSGLYEKQGSGVPEPATVRPAGPADPEVEPEQGGAAERGPADFKVVFSRRESPTQHVPMAYREEAYSVSPSPDGTAAQALLWARFQEVHAELADEPAAKLVQMGVFDHVFTSRPLRGPVATLVWKSWHGAPELRVGGERVAVPGSERFVAAVGMGSQPATEPTESAVAGPGAGSSGLAESESKPEGASEPGGAPASESSAAQPGGAPASESSAAQPGGAAASESSAAPAAQGGGAPAGHEAEVPPRRSNEDLIGELFELMHELHFVRDVVAGCEFVLEVLNKTLPSELAMLHVFDIDTAQFVVVRARGPSAEKVVLHRTPDREPLFEQAMQAPAVLRFEDAAEQARYRAERWDLLGATPRAALCGAARQGGRYLGIIEVANPAGGEPFTQSEANALDYICAQFADFLADRPIVLDAEVVLRRAAGPLPTR